jgi:hypothetical protein
MDIEVEDDNLGRQAVQGEHGGEVFLNSLATYFLQGIFFKEDIGCALHGEAS